jgi:Xaa-Pro aminopeptidase
MLQPELKFRRDKIRYLMAQQGIDAALIACNVNLLYTYGEIVNGYLYLPLHSPALLFVKRPNNIVGEFVFPIRKPEQIVDLLKENGIPVASKIMLEGGELPYADYMRLASLFPESEVVDGTAIIREARSVKTPLEIELFRRSAALHARAYSKIPDVYHPGMTDRELSVEVERLMRLEGCLGIFRVFGQSMEIFMGSVLAGDNAATPSPYDFALGGKGLDPSLPGGMNGTLLKEGYSVMVDIGGNFYGYMCDMSRVFSIGKLNDEAYAAHQVCLEVQDKVASMTAPGVVLVPLVVWNSKQFQDWYTYMFSGDSQGNELRGFDIKTILCFSNRRSKITDERALFGFAAHVNIWVAREQREKSNEWIFSRTATSYVIPYYVNKEKGYREYILVREFRSPANNESGYVYELPGGSAPDDILIGE